MLKKSFLNRIQIPLQKVNELSEQLSQKHMNIFGLYHYLKRLVGSEQSELEFEEADALDILNNFYLTLQKNIEFLP